MKYINLTKNKRTLVDDEDYEKLNRYKWCYHSSGYAVRFIGNKKMGYMHRIITNVLKGLEVDHINGDGLDNRKINLRVSSHSRNMQNSKKPKNNTSGYKGVVERQYRKRISWIAQISFNNKNVYLGSWKTKEDASLAYNLKAQELFGEYARLNSIEPRR